MDDREDINNVNDQQDGGAGPEYPGDVNSFSFSGIMRDSWACYKSGFLKLLMLVLAVTLPLAILQVFVIDLNFEKATPASLLLDNFNNAAGAEAAIQDLGDLYGKVLLYLGITALLTSISLITEAGAVIYAGSRMGSLHVPDNSPSHRMAAEGEMTFSLLFELSFRSFPKLLFTVLIVRLFTGLGLMLCFIPGIFIYYVTIYAAYSVELTGLWGRKAIFVSTLCTRKYPKVSALFAILFFVGAEVLLSLALNGIISLVALLGAGTAVSGMIEVLLICLKQLVLLFFATCGAVLFSKMLPGIEPLISESGIRGNRRTL